MLQLKLGAECIKVALVGGYLFQDNPRSRVLRDLVGADRALRLDQSFRQGLQQFLPSYLTQYYRTPDIDLTPTQEDTPVLTDAMNSTTGPTTGPESDEAYVPATPYAMHPSGAYVTPTDMSEVLQGAEQKAPEEAPETAFSEPPNDIVKEARLYAKWAKSEPSLTAKDKNPKGGLSASGRKKLQRAGQNILPGVKGKADTPTKKRRKGSFLARHYCGPDKPLKEDDGDKTRHSLQATAWGESAPTSQGAVRKLCEKGRNHLEAYRNNKEKRANVGQYGFDDFTEDVFSGAAGLGGGGLAANTSLKYLTGHSATDLLNSSYRNSLLRKLDMLPAEALPSDVVRKAFHKGLLRNVGKWAPALAAGGATVAGILGGTLTAGEMRQAVQAQQERSERFREKSAARRPVIDLGGLIGEENKRAFELRQETEAFVPQHPATLYGVDPGKQRLDAEVRRDQDHAAEPPRQGTNNDFIDMTIG